MIEYKIKSNSFIGGWYISKEICDSLINYFKNSEEKQTIGLSGYGLDKTIKDSIDLSINYNNFNQPIKSYRDELHKCLLEYCKKFYYVNEISKFGILENYNIQYYKQGGGFKKYHFERSIPKNSKRVLVFMTYLNDVKNGGTDFLYQKIKTPAKKGLTLIWPTDWTHTHKSIISNNNEKYIITGWYSFYE